ncbi:MAG TPA: hypothetical protein DDW52_22420 [Planctomycetaceae bacterium]|nr:hypothetical protein [Planctomycetaceae bacterium]
MGCLLGVSALAAFLPVAIIGRPLHQSNADPTMDHALVGWTCLAIYAMAALTNFHLSFIRPWIHSRWGEGEYKFVSGIPVAHSLFLLVAIVALPSSVIAGILMLLLLGLDTGAAHWVAITAAFEFRSKGL